MDNKLLEIYRTKNIYIGYMTTINPESLTIEDTFEKDVVAFKKRKNEKGLPIYIPLNGKTKYYTNIEMIELRKIIKRDGFVTLGVIEKVVEQEKKKQGVNLERENFLQNENDSDLEKAQNIALINNELDINKTKQLVA